VVRRLLEDWPQIKAPRLTEILRADYGYTGSLRLVQARLCELRRGRCVRRTGRATGRARCCSSTGPRWRVGRSLPVGSGVSTRWWRRRAIVSERLAEERAALRPLPPTRFEWSGHRPPRVPIDGYLRHGSCFYRAPERLMHQRGKLHFGSVGDSAESAIRHTDSEICQL
jgi:hypothetical protein